MNRTPGAASIRFRVPSVRSRLVSAKSLASLRGFSFGRDGSQHVHHRIGARCRNGTLHRLPVECINPSGPRQPHNLMPNRGQQRHQPTPNHTGGTSN